MKAVIGTLTAFLFFCGASHCSAVIDLAGLSKQQTEAKLGVVIRSEPITPNYSDTEELGISVEFVPKADLEDFLFAVLDVYTNSLGHVGRQRVCSVTLMPLVHTKEKVRFFLCGPPDLRKWHGNNPPSTCARPSVMGCLHHPTKLEGFR